MLKLFEVMKEIPVVNIIPLIVTVSKDIPNAWEAMPAEERQAAIQTLIRAGVKAAATYAA